MTDYLDVNKATWDRRAETHFKSAFYDVSGFLEGNSSLNSIELNGLGEVRDKSLLHLQCHFGLDTLSWSRLGATVTGVDLSAVAIDKAHSLADQTGLDARFICADVYQYGESTSEQFDIVFTSYGAICWLPDVHLWAKVVAKSLKPGGTFYMAEFHPVYDLLTGYSYFHKPAPDIEEEDTYTDNAQGELSTVMVWSHPISDVVNALIGVGIQIEHLKEFPYSPHNCFEGLEEQEKGRYALLKNGHAVPLVYSIRGKMQRK